VFLDEIELSVGQERQRLTGGYQLLRMLEVGPLLATGAVRPAGPDEFEEVPAASPIDCRGGRVCQEVSRLEEELPAAEREPSGAGA
jgi:hypothetical protein